MYNGTYSILNPPSPKICKGTLFNRTCTFQGYIKKETLSNYLYHCGCLLKARGEYYSIFFLPAPSPTPLEMHNILTTQPTKMDRLLF